MNKEFWEIWLVDEKVRETDFKNYLESKKIKILAEYRYLPVIYLKAISMRG